MRRPNYGEQWSHAFFFGALEWAHTKVLRASGVLSDSEATQPAPHGGTPGQEDRT